MPGLPRLAISVVSSRPTRLPEIDVSGIAARHSRVTSSTTLRMRNRCPQANWSCTKSSDQRALGFASTGIGARSHGAAARADGPKVRDGVALDGGPYHLFDKSSRSAAASSI